MKRFILLTTCMCGITVCFLVIAFMAIPAGRIGDIYILALSPRGSIHSSSALRAPHKA